MTDVTINEQMTVNQNCEVYNCEIANGYTLPTQFDTIIAVVMTNEETGVGVGTYGGYATSGSQITFYVDSTTTWSVIVVGRK